MSLPDSLAAFWSASVEWVLLVWLFALGAIVGSFVNVVAYRLPRGMSLVRPSSRCPACSTSIAARDNLPIIGWLVLGGRCRICRQPISPRYPMVELLLAIVFVLLAWHEPMSGRRRVPGSGIRVQQSQFMVRGEDQSPWQPPTEHARPMSPQESWGVYTYHLCLLCSLVAASLIEFDGQRFSGRLLLPGLAIGSIAPLVWPHLRPMESGLLAAASHPGRLAAAVDGAAGLALGLALGWVATAVAARASPLEKTSQGSARWQFGVALGWVGAFLGWQATAALGVAATATWCCFSLAARVVSPLRRIGPVLCLMPWTLAWILNGKTITDRAPWLGPGATVLTFLAASTSVVAAAWLVRMARPDELKTLASEDTNVYQGPA